MALLQQTIVTECQVDIIHMTGRSFHSKSREYGPFDLTLMDNPFDPYTPSTRGRARAVQAPRSRLSESTESRPDQGSGTASSATSRRATPSVTTDRPSPTLVPIIVTPESYPRPWVPQNTPRRVSLRRRDPDASDTQESLSRPGPAGFDSPPTTTNPTSIGSTALSSRRSSDDVDFSVAPNPFQRFDMVSPLISPDPQNLRLAERNALVAALRTHRINTITELRRAERLLVKSDPAEVTEAMMVGWTNYVNSHNLLHELRASTKTYPFSSECLDEAKTLVLNDKTSARSWNFCWLVLMKIRQARLLPKHADELARRPATWGGREPSQNEVERLVAACVAEWSRTLDNMLRHWRDGAPSLTGTNTVRFQIQNTINEEGDALMEEDQDQDDNNDDAEGDAADDSIAEED